MYRCGVDGLPAFIDTGAPADDGLHALVQTLVARLRSGLGPEPCQKRSILLSLSLAEAALQRLEWLERQGG